MSILDDPKTKELSTDEMMVGVLTVIDQLQQNVEALTNRIKALETVIADALPDFTSETVKDYAIKKRSADLAYYKNELLGNMYATMNFNQDAYNSQHNVTFTLNIGDKVVSCTGFMKKPTITFV